MKKELLGEVLLPSGIALIIDTGLLNLWSHDQVPELPEGVYDDATRAKANAARDFRITGPDAEAAGRAFDRQWHPLYLYDMPAPSFERDFEAFARSHGLDASLVSQQPRISHRRRVTLAIEHGHGAGVVQFHGVPAIAVAALPPNRALQVYGERMGEEPFSEPWRTVMLEVQPGAKAHRTIEIGSVGVDWARLMVVDADALGGWQHEQPIDGRADFVFWGRDAEQAAAKTQAPRLSATEFGWLDLEVGVAVARGTAVEQLRETSPLKFATDFRPHSHHYQLLAQMRSSRTESGTLQLGESKCCGFFTLWGDGFFPVHVELAEDGGVVRVVMELGTKEAVRNMRAVNGLPPG